MIIIVLLYLTPKLFKTRKVVTPDYQSLLTLNLILRKNHVAKIMCNIYTCKSFSKKHRKKHVI